MLFQLLPVGNRFCNFHTALIPLAVAKGTDNWLQALVQYGCNAYKLPVQKQANNYDEKILCFRSTKYSPAISIAQNNIHKLVKLTDIGLNNLTIPQRFHHLKDGIYRMCSRNYIDYKHINLFSGITWVENMQIKLLSMKECLRVARHIQNLDMSGRSA